MTLRVGTQNRQEKCSLLNSLLTQTLTLPQTGHSDEVFRGLVHFPFYADPHESGLRRPESQSAPGVVNWSLFGLGAVLKSAPSRNARKVAVGKHSVGTGVNRIAGSDRRLGMGQ